MVEKWERNKEQKGEEHKNGRYHCPGVLPGSHCGYMNKVDVLYVRD